MDRINAEQPETFSHTETLCRPVWSSAEQNPKHVQHYCHTHNSCNSAYWSDWNFLWLTLLNKLELTGASHELDFKNVARFGSRLCFVIPRNVLNVSLNRRTREWRCGLEHLWSGVWRTLFMCCVRKHHILHKETWPFKFELCWKQNAAVMVNVRIDVSPRVWYFSLVQMEELALLQSRAWAHQTHTVTQGSHFFCL